MAELTTKERLQPSLLDRLTDPNPEQKAESREARVMNESQLRECVRRDLSWLLNTTHMAAVQELEAESEVSRSVVNFGICDLAGQTFSGISGGASMPADASSRPTHCCEKYCTPQP